MAGPTALLDANVLYPAGLRDILLRLADRYLYSPRWSADIHAEWMRSLLADWPDLSVAALGARSPGSPRTGRPGADGIPAATALRRHL